MGKEKQDEFYMVWEVKNIKDGEVEGGQFQGVTYVKFAKDDVPSFDLAVCVDFCAGFSNEQLKEMGSLKEQLDAWGKESYKFSCVLEKVTGGGMSYTHYDLETMNEHIHRFLCQERDEAFKEGEEIGKLNAEVKQ